MADQDDVPSDDWKRAAAARELLRNLPGPGSEHDDPAEIINQEIVSSLKNEKEEIPGPAGGRLIKTVIERRGLRASARRIYNDPLENFAQQHIFGQTPADTYELLFQAADRHLRAKGEMTFFDVAATAEQLADAQDLDLDQTTSLHFDLWVEKMKFDTGKYSIETAAASFIHASDKLFMLLNQNEEVQAAAHAYADAWHWFHMELMGEHELAAKGATAEKSLNAGRAARKSESALKFGLIAEIYAIFASEETREAYRTNVGFVAPEILEKVNEAFQEKGLAPIAVGTLKNRLPAIIKDYEAKRKSGSGR